QLPTHSLSITVAVCTISNITSSYTGAHHPSVNTQIKTEQQNEQIMQRLGEELLNHRAITANSYTSWFASGQVSHKQLQAFIVQFSVFSNQFLIAQLLKMLAANSLEEMRASKEILANEIGVAFSGSVSHGDTSEKMSNDEQRFGAITGSIEGGRFHFRAAHFELLLRCAESIGLGFEDLGKRELGSQETLFFCDELRRLYGSTNYQVSAAASFAVEHWAAAGFWQELENGLTKLKAQPQYLQLPLTFFSWHNKLEANHAHHTREELKEFYVSKPMDEDAFIVTGNTMLDAVYRFWEGLEKQRLIILH
ncbi:MAG: hypothetical protein V3T17_13925, partial [Pseudomonadales bacterium]